MSGAAVLIVDEATGVPRTLETDAQGRYEAANLQPGTYRVEVVTTNFKKAERTGVLLRAAATALVDINLELGGVNETVTVSADAINNITLDSQAIARGLDEQQLRDLPRDTRDIQSFLLLNPNVVGGSGDTDIQFLGGKTYGVSYIQDGQASTNAIFGTVGNSAPGLDAVSELQVLSNSYSAEYGGLAGVIVTTKRGGSSFRGTSFYDFNSDSLNALTYNQTLVRRSARRSRSPTRTSIAGARASAARCSATSCSSSGTMRGRTTRPSSAAGARPSRRRPCATGISAAPPSRQGTR